MEIKRFNLDRQPLSSEYIASKQNYKAVMANVSTNRHSGVRSPLFFGAVGLSSIGLIAVLGGMIQQSKELPNDNQHISGEK